MRHQIFLAACHFLPLRKARALRGAQDDPPRLGIAFANDQPLALERRGSSREGRLRNHPPPLTLLCGGGAAAAPSGWTRCRKQHAHGLVALDDAARACELFEDGALDAAET